MDAYAGPNTRVLEIGCGTGEDAIHFAAKGCHVTATDASEAMLEQVENKIANSPLSDSIEYLRWNLNAATPSQIAGAEPFDTVFSNFGAFNCIDLDSSVAESLAACTRPGGHLAIVAMSRYCPWEIIWFGLRGARHNALRRLQVNNDADTGDSQLVVRYPSTKQLADTLKPHFAIVARYGIGFFLPPSFAFHVVDRWPRLFERLRSWEERVAQFWPFTRLNDHNLAIFRRI
jgi:SAM-dependent methyltransferase